MMRGLALLTSVYLLPSLFNVITTATNKMTSGCRRFMLTSVAMFTFLIQASGIVLVTYQGFVYNSTEAQRLREASEAVPADEKRGLGIERSPVVVGQDFSVELPVALVLVSFGFCENFIDGEFRLLGLTIKMRTWKGRLNLVRQRVYILVSVFKASATIVLAVLLVPGFNFTLTFAPDVIAALTSSEESKDDPEVHLRMYGPLYAMLVSGVVCSYMSGLACKLCMQVIGFALPLSLVTPISVTMLMLDCQYHVLRVPPNPISFYTWVCPPVTVPPDSGDGGGEGEGWTVAWWFRGGGFYQHVVLLAVLWLSQLMLTAHVWRPTCGRMEKIQKLFITPMRCGILTEQTLMARRRIVYTRNFQSLDGDATFQSEEMSGRTDSVPLIYACATMWHETRKEMVQLMKSIFRMDIDRSARFIAQKYYKIKDPEYYDFEAHIFFDDAMKLSEDLRHIPNSFVSTFMDCLDDAISAVHERPTSLGDPVRTPSPYGGRLTWILPGGTPLVVHMKDKNKIRHKKRWSQVMYMYYLLGFKILANSELQVDQEPEMDSASSVSKNLNTSRNMGRSKLTSSELRRRRAASHFTRSIIFNYVPEEIQIQAENTYILALDGDVDFKPEAVRLLLDRMKKNTKVGAACGRIHPTGSGPIVWYQKFEYAIGHWLQKATEHVFGCVLCAPGCFSLFRGSALMDDNVVRMYAMRSTQAAHYVQYDQGEDRWLSTLLLQQGYRIDYTAAADALTHAPEKFSEFFNQRRRWGPSTLANLMDLLGDWRNSVRLNDNLSTIYMVYQCMMLVSTVLGPATIVLLMAGSFRVVFKISVVESYMLTLFVPAAYLLLCLYARPAMQLQMGAFLSALYALVMTIVLVGTVGTAIDGSITSPNVLFLFTIILIFSVSGFVHPRELYCILPGILYLIMIPAGYLILTIYYLCNLHVVSWGTRETQSPNPPQQQQPQEIKSCIKTDKKEKGGILGWFGTHHLLKEMCKILKQLQEIFSYMFKHSETKASRTDQLLQELIAELRREKGYATNDQTGQNQTQTNSASAAKPSSASQEGHGSFSRDPRQPARMSKRVSAPHRPESGISEADEQNTIITSLGLSRPEGINDEEEQIFTGNNNIDSNDTQGYSSRAVSDVEAVGASWLTSEVCGEGPVTELTPREEAFWRQLIGTYLYPLNEDKDHLEKMNAHLLSLRNIVVFGFFMSSAIWVALTMQLEVLQNDLEAYLFIHINRFNESSGGPPLRFQPLGLFFLGSFAIILLTQFVGMFAHRWGTFLHTLSITDIGVGNAEDSEQNKAREAIFQVIELQRLRNIELEPEPDYDEPLPDYNNDNTNSVINPIFIPDTADINNTAGNFFQFRENNMRPDDDAFSLASRAGLSFQRPQGSGFRLSQGAGFRPHPHSSLVPAMDFRPYQEARLPPFQPAGQVPPMGSEDGKGFSSRFSTRPSMGRGMQGPLGNFTLQRAFEKRYRNQMGLRVNRLQMVNSPFQAPSPQPFGGGQRTSMFNVHNV